MMAAMPVCYNRYVTLSINVGTRKLILQCILVAQGVYDTRSPPSIPRRLRFFRDTYYFAHVVTAHALALSARYRNDADFFYVKQKR